MKFKTVGRIGSWTKEKCSHLKPPTCTKCFIINFLLGWLDYWWSDFGIFAQGLTNKVLTIKVITLKCIFYFLCHVMYEEKNRIDFFCCYKSLVWIFWGGKHIENLNLMVIFRLSGKVLSVILWLIWSRSVCTHRLSSPDYWRTPHWGNWRWRTHWTLEIFQYKVTSL